MIKVLNSRLRKVEEDTRDRWLARPEAKDPWAWTKRFAAATPRYAELVEWALKNRLDGEYPYLPEKEPPGVRADILSSILVRATKPWTRPKRELETPYDMEEFKRYWEEWNPTQQQQDALFMFGELHDLGKAYAQFDPAPWPLSWAHPSLLQNRRGRAGR